MLKRCIMIFPQFENGEIIDRIREKYDPLAGHVRPHITLVFPFESDIETNQLKEHISSIASDYSRFEIILRDFTPEASFGKYLFLNIDKGNDVIIDLHKRLYSGILNKYYPDWLMGIDYLPHMTVGSFNDDKEFEEAIIETINIKGVFKTIVEKISVEIIDENEDSIIEFEVSLK